MTLRHKDFPWSFHDPFFITSPATGFYNCIAWAYEDPTKWYWPDDAYQYYWPNQIPRIATIDAGKELFKLKSYTDCEDGSVETGFKKIALFVKDGKLTHAARQLANGYWSSKLGPDRDVSHTIFAISGGVYGEVVQYMRVALS